MAKWMRDLVAIPLVALIAMTNSSSANGPRLRVVQGEVMINDGQGYRQLPSGSEVVQGQQLLTGPNTICELDYADGSVVRLPPGQTVIASDQPILTVVDAPLPNGGALLSNGGNWTASVTTGEAVVDTVGAGGAVSGVSTTMVLAVVGTAGAVAGIVAVAGSGSSSKPASP